MDILVHFQKILCGCKICSFKMIKVFFGDLATIIEFYSSGRGCGVNVDLRQLLHPPHNTEALNRVLLTGEREQ